jgi:hypothetical protein
MIEPKWVSGDFIPQQLADVSVEENIAGLTEIDESDHEFNDVLYSLIDMHIMMPILDKFYPFLYLKTGTNIHDIHNISTFQFHSSTNELNNEY